MKNPKWITCIILAIVLFSPAHGLNAGDGRHALTVDVLLPVGSIFSQAFGEMAWIPVNVKYQQLVGDNVALMAKAGVNYSWAKGEKILEGYPMIAMEYHPFDTGLNGFYFGPSLLLSYCRYYNDYSKVRNPDHTYRIALGANVGWEFILPSNTVIDVTFGLGCGYNKEVYRHGESDAGYSIDESIGGIFVGYRF